MIGVKHFLGDGPNQRRRLYTVPQIDDAPRCALNIRIGAHGSGAAEIYETMSESELRELGAAFTAAAGFLRRVRLGRCANPRCRQPASDGVYCGSRCHDLCERRTA